MNVRVASGAAPIPPTATFSVMCIDDNRMLVDALNARLAMEPGFRGLVRVDDFARSVELAVEHAPSVVILDVDLPGVDSLEILAGIVAQAPESRVIVFTGHPTRRLVTASLAAGAWGFVSKGITADRVITAIHRVLSGEAVIALDD